MLPEQFTSRMEKMLGEEYPAFFQTYQEKSWHSLNVNLRKADPERFAAGKDWILGRVPWARAGFYYDDAAKPGRHPLHEAGVYYIQEPSAMAPVSFLDVRPGDRVLDLCAAPGGKSVQIADALGGEGLLVCNEVHPKRAAVLSGNMERMGVANALVTNEKPERLAAFFAGYFDRILVDAPCSGEGMFRKNPEACAEWSPENVALCADRQDGILSCAAGMLRPGGLLVYSTCTFSPEEDEGSVSRFLHGHPEFEAVPVRGEEGFGPGDPSLVEDPADGVGLAVRLLPHRVRGEGHFFAVLKKAGNGEPLYKKNAAGGVMRGLSVKECGSYREFAGRYLSSGMPDGTYLRFGEQLYLGAPDMPDVKGLKVLRPGLHLGLCRKDRFEPAHALALFLKPGQTAQVLSLSADGPEVLRFIEGQTLAVGREDGLMVRRGADGAALPEAKGWCLVCADGYSLGWGKISGAVVKNHYPKGLRKKI